jgi:hypothetical protein
MARLFEASLSLSQQVADPIVQENPVLNPG